MLVILNHAAGSAFGKTDERLRELFAAHGVKVRIVHPGAGGDLVALARDGARTEQVVVAGGGDGTISTVAAEVVAAEKTLGVLPVGTLNHFAKDMGIPLDLAKAVAVIAEGHTTEVDVGEVNGRIFINNSSLGIYPRIVLVREAQQERHGRRKWPAFFRAAVRALWRFPRLDLQVTVAGRVLKRRTAFLFIGNNEYAVEGFSLGGRACLDGGKFGLYLTHRTGRWGLLRIGVRALLGRINQARDFESFAVEEAIIESRKACLQVATDGEVNPMETPLRYRSRPRALRVLTPRPPA